MKTKEFNLSDKRVCMSDHDCKIFECSFGYPEEDIKEFIRRLKEEIIIGNPHSRQMLIKINTLAGDKLK